ncbi:hypothetical protein G4B88_029627 [Cannabis sativa]|uniref:Uncharacterized protein n=1 Tax=Cannabis sativa TaxID=3483 RepID=A0A7J6FSX5_CANSA|nr:hypothetical protein G4B88_007831 [Cannabis sativa]KAF4373677.1 hypothetical protein G4B88_029627 [Cannabis sativa]
MFVTIHITNWIRNIEQHGDNVKKILVGNKADMDESRRSQLIFVTACAFSDHNNGFSFQFSVEGQREMKNAILT